MFHYRSCGTANLVALMAAHRIASREVTALHQKDVMQMLHRLEEEAPARREEAGPSTHRALWEAAKSS